jgi:hypothetical protein
MAPRTFITAVALAALTAAPAIADAGQHQRDNGQSRDRSRETRQAPARQNPAPRQNNERAVTRSNQAPRQNQAQVQQQRQAPQPPVRQFQQQRQAPQPPVRQLQQQRQNDVQRRSDVQRQAPRQLDQRNFATPRQFESGRSVDNRRFDNRSFDNRGFNGRRFETARIIRPSIINVAPYRFYSYRPSFRIGVYYGLDGYYPYGYTPPEYFQIVPGRIYGGVRITGAPRDAQVFADGYFVGIVDDFDGIFQHMNLEAGPHHIEVQEAGMGPIAFDVDVRPGQTTTFRADLVQPY